MLKNKEVLIIGTVWPEPNSSAAGTRMMQLIEFFKSKEAHITFACSASNLEFSTDLTSLGIDTKQISINDSSFNEFVRKLNPEFVLFDRFMTEEQFGWRVAEECPNAIRILDSEDLHFLRLARHKSVKDGNKCTREDLYSEHSKREIASIYRCDVTLVISKFEYELLINVFKIDPDILLYLPFMYEEIDLKFIDSVPTFSDRNHFVTIGNFLHKPNWDAVLYLKSTVWPLIRKELPTSEMHVYGAYTSPKVEQLHSEEQGFLIKGRAKSSKEVISRARLLLAPIRFGAGLKGKLVEAMQYGTPSITSEVGAEGFKYENQWNGAIANSPIEFANHAIQHYRDEELWEKKQEIGFSIFNSLFDVKEHSVRLESKLVETHSKLKSHRNKNFIGSMLLHHTMNSYKYMSKWIEAKNA